MHIDDARALITVGEALGIDVADALALPRFDPRSQERPAVPVRASRRGSYTTAAVVDGALGPFRPDAEAGVSDALLAQRSGRSVGQVRQWRRRQGIRGRRGRAKRELAVAYMLGGLLAGEPALQHDVSPVRGAWAPPQYVLREPLHYRAFAEVCHRLVTELGYSTSEVAHAVGVLERDVEHAVRLFDARGTR